MGTTLADKHWGDNAPRGLDSGGRIIMAARKSVLKPAPQRPDLDRLVAKALAAGVTDDQLLEQRVSFTYGNAPEGSRITKDSARKAASGVRLTR